MGRKKKKPIKPWCWYCNREFDDDKILIHHQRAKHYKCPFCHKKLYSGPGLTVHCVQVHKEKLDKIPEALPNRNSVDIDIYGMQGIPEEDQREHERLKRGYEGPSKSEQESKNQPSKPTNSIQSRNMGLPQPNHMMGMGMMPPSFPMGMPPMGMPPLGMPPMGMPPGFPPGFMPPPGFHQMPPPHMHPGMPIPGQNFGMPPMLSQTSMANSQFPPQSMGFPPLPNTSASSSPPASAPKEEPTTSGTNQPLLPPPAPMSGVGHLIGIPPPMFKPLNGPPSQILSQTRAPNASHHEIDTRNDRNLHAHPARSHHHQRPTKEQEHDNASSKPSSSTVSSASATIIAKPAIISGAETTAVVRNTLRTENFIDIPTMNARIMHPDKDLSLEEIRFSLSKYREMMRKGGLVDEES